MPIPAYLSIKGVYQGNISGDTGSKSSMGNKWQAGHEDEILVQAFEHEVKRATDPQSGQPTSPAGHLPFTIVKGWDKSTPLLFQALCQNERLYECELKLYRTNAHGKQEHYFTVSLEDATIVNISSELPNCQSPFSRPYDKLEAVSFSYKSISWKHEICGTEIDDGRNQNIGPRLSQAVGGASQIALGGGICYGTGGMLCAFVGVPLIAKGADSLQAAVRNKPSASHLLISGVTQNENTASWANLGIDTASSLYGFVRLIPRLSTIGGGTTSTTRLSKPWWGQNHPSYTERAIKQTSKGALGAELTTNAFSAGYTYEATKK